MHATTTTATAAGTRCLSCHRVLRSASSIALGRGPVCARKIRAAAHAPHIVERFKPEAIAKATELIEQVGLVPTKRHGVYTAVSKDGSVTYLVHRNTCTCAAGMRGRYTCYHRVAVAIVEAAAPVRIRILLAA